jgi:hypothetical protein
LSNYVREEPEVSRHHQHVRGNAHGGQAQPAAPTACQYLGRSETVFYSRPDISYVPIPELVPDQVCLAVAAARTSPLADDFLAAAQATAEITAECGNYDVDAALLEGR